MSGKKNIIVWIGLLSLIFLGCERNVSVPPPDEPPPQGYIFINTYPEGMQIFMDGKERRRITPDSITWLETKEYEFTLKHPFFLDTVFQFLANENQRESLFIDYRENKKMLAALEINSYPQGASIYLNDSLLFNKTPVLLENLLPGYYNVRYVLENHRATEHTVILQSNKKTVSFLPMLDITLWVDYNSINSNLKSNNLTCMAKYPDGNILIGSEDWGIYTFDGSIFKSNNSGNSGVLNNKINDIKVLPNQTVLIAADGNAMYAPYEKIFGANTGHRWQYWEIDDTVVNLPDNFVTSIAVEENGGFWFGTKNGLISLFPEGENFIQKIYTSENSQLPENNITDLAFINNELWIGTKSSGLVQIKNLDRNKEWVTFSTGNSGLPTNVINSIYPIDNFECYFGTSTNSAFTPGLAYVDNGLWFTEYFDMPDNNVLSVYQDSRGRTWVGTETSIIVFTNWEDRKVYTYNNSGLPVEKISGFLEDTNGNILITSLGGGLFIYLK